MELPSIDSLIVVLQKHRSAFNLNSIDHLDIKTIGQGEANLNLLVTVNHTERFNLRLGLRGEESAEKLGREFEVLQRVPSGVGPAVFALDVSQTDLPQPYLLLEYIPGEIKSTWSLADLQAHARTLAQLHQRKFDQYGEVDQLRPPPYDFQHRFEVAVNYWQTHHPDLLTIPVVQQLLPAIRHFVMERQPLFTSLRHFSLVHGDAHPLNILLNGEQVRYIDWEWASIGDPAQDVAMVGWDIATAWQIELTGERLTRFLESYLAWAADETLPQRRDVWMVYTMFFDQMYHRTQIAHDTTGRQAYTVQQIETYLRHRFL